MANAFTLFGELKADTSAFERSLKDAETRLKGTSAQLDKTISASNRLGDTSATVARRYEKLSDGIAIQNKRLAEAAAAYQSGDINAKKFAQTVISVDKATESLSSRLKDAAARANELNETGLTHFQNQIKGSVGELEKAHSLINLNAARPLQGLGPVLQGLGARSFGLDETILNILIVAAREAGILKVAQQGTAAATQAAAVAQTEFVAASKAGAVAEAELALSAEATAAATTEAATATTVLGASLASIAIVGATIAASAALSYKISKDILASAEQRLKTEEAIEGAINKQYLALSEFKSKQAEQSDNAAFGRFTGSDRLGDMREALRNLQSQSSSEAQAVIDEQLRRKGINDRFGFTGQKAVDYVKDAAPAGFDEKQKQQQTRILALQARIDELSQPQSSGDFIKNIQDRQLEVAKENEKNALEADKKAASERKKLVDEAIRKAKEFAKEAIAARASVADIFLGTESDNPFVKIFKQGEDALERVRKASALFGKDIQSLLTDKVNAATNAAFRAQSVDSRLTAFNLRDDAANFRRGSNDSAAVRAIKEQLERSDLNSGQTASLNRQLKSAEQSDFQANLSAKLAAVLGNQGPLNPNSKDFQKSKFLQAVSALPDEAKDKRIIALTQGLDPSKLTAQQNDLAAGARERDARRVEEQQKEEIGLRKKLNTVLEKLDATISSGAVVKVIDESDRASVTRRPSNASTTAYYKR